MRPYSLASVLIKVLGISCVIEGLCQISTAMTSVVIPIILIARGTSVTAGKAIDFLLRGILLPSAIISLGLGLFLLLKADFIVKKILKIADSGPDA